MYLRLGTDGWYCVSKGKMVFPLEGLCWSASFLFSKCISAWVRVIKFCGNPLSLRCFWNSSSLFWKFSFEEFVLSSWKASPFIKPFLPPNGWQDVEMCILKCFSWLKMRSYVENWRTVKPFPLVHNCIQKCDFVLKDFWCEFDKGVVIICLFSEVCYFFSSGIPREDVVYISFSTDRLFCAFV